MGNQWGAGVHFILGVGGVLNGTGIRKVGGGMGGSIRCLISYSRSDVIPGDSLTSSPPSLSWHLVPKLPATPCLQPPVGRSLSAGPISHTLLPSSASVKRAALGSVYRPPTPTQENYGQCVASSGHLGWPTSLSIYTHPRLPLRRRWMLAARMADHDADILIFTLKPQRLTYHNYPALNLHIDFLKLPLHVTQLMCDKTL